MHTCGQCDRTFPNPGALAHHQVAHRTRPCRHCGNDLAVNSLGRHEKLCPNQQPPLDIIPEAAGAAQLERLLSRTHELPANGAALLCAGEEPVFMHRDAVMRHVLGGCRPCQVIPVAAIDPALIEGTRPVRDRRKQPTPEPESTEPGWEPTIHLF